MKKLFLSLIVTVLLGLLFWTHPAGLNAQTPPTHDAVALRYHETMSKVKTEWADTTLSQRIRLKGENGIPKAYLYRVESEGRQQGYMVTMNIKGTIQISEATFSGEDPLKDNHKNEYYIAPMQFMTRKEYNHEVSKDAQKIDDSINYDSGEVSLYLTEPWQPEYLVPVPDSYFSSYYNSYYSEIKVEETPEYFNYSFGPVNNGCGPTTGAMLTSFYDRVALPNLVDGTLPSSHYTDSGDSDEDVDNHIITMADYMNTCSDINGDLSDEDNCGGTYPRDAMSGFEKYFSNMNYPYYNAHYSNTMSDYDKLILEANPVYLRLEDENLNHAVLGIGRASPYGSEDKFIVRYNHTDKSGEYHVSTDLFNGFIYISQW